MYSNSFVIIVISLKKKIIIVIRVVLIFMLAACKEDGPKVPSSSKGVLIGKNIENGVYCQLSTNSIELPSPLEYQATINVNAYNVDWEFISIPQWISINPTKGSGSAQVTIKVDQNIKTYKRTSQIICHASGLNDINLQISQVGATPYISFSNKQDEYITVNGKEHYSGTIELNTNVDTIDIVYLGEECNWCSLEVKGISRTLYYDITEANTGVDDRSIGYKLNALGVSITGEIVQKPANIVSSYTPAVFGVYGGQDSIVFESEAEWEASAPSWGVDIQPSSGPAGKNAIVLTTLANNTERPNVGSVYIRLSEKNLIEIPIFQDGISFSFNEDGKTINVPSNGDNIELDIKANVRWAFDSVPNWIHINTINGEGDISVLIDIEENETFKPRRSVISVAPVNNNALSKHLSLLQSYLDTTSLYFNNTINSAKIKINATGEWNLISNQSWISINPSEGNGECLVDVLVSENNDNEERIGKIDIVGEDVEGSLTVYQGLINHNYMDFDSRPSTQQFDLCLDAEWNCKTDVTWIEIPDSCKEGLGNKVLYFSVSDNPTNQVREGKIYINPLDAKQLPIIIDVKQTGRYLKVYSTDTIHVIPRGGNKGPIRVETDGVWSFKQTEDWINVSVIDDVMMVGIEPNYSLQKRIGRLDIYVSDLIEGEISHCLVIEQEEVGITELIINRGADTINVGESIELSALVFSGDSLLNVVPDWHSTDNAIAVVNSDGLVFAKSVGVCSVIATITTPDKVFADSCSITVPITNLESCIPAMC